VLDSVADVSDKTDIFDSICVHRLAALHLSSGAWSEEEESQLLHAMKGLAKEGRTDKSARGYWVSVSKALDATQTPKQCQNKWCGVLCSSRFYNATFTQFRVCRYESLRGKVRNAGKTRRWKHEDSYILICKCVTCVPDHRSSFGPDSDTKCIGLLLLISTRKQTLIGSLSLILHGACGAATISRGNGNGSRHPAMLTTVLNAIVVSTWHSSSSSSCLIFLIDVVQHLVAQTKPILTAGSSASSTIPLFPAHDESVRLPEAQ
jgi:Myb-like DNA-binding domain